MFTRKKTVDCIVKRFTIMAEDLDVIMNEEADKVDKLQEELQNLEHEINRSLTTQTRASKIKSNILSLIK